MAGLDRVGLKGHYLRPLTENEIDRICQGSMNGAMSLRERAGETVARILEQHQPPPLGEEASRRIAAIVAEVERR
ncbi:MAG: hypothetical protein ACE5F6_02210 [Anaerolineae bacterium]